MTFADVKSVDNGNENTRTRKGETVEPLPLHGLGPDHGPLPEAVAASREHGLQGGKAVSPEPGEGTGL